MASAHDRHQTQAGDVCAPGTISVIRRTARGVLVPATEYNQLDSRSGRGV